MSDFAEKNTAGRPRWRHLLPLVLLVLVPIVLAPAGSAKPPATTKFELCVQNAATQSPSCGGSAASVFPGNSVATIQLSVTNDSSSTSSIGSADIVVPDQLKVVAGSAAPTKYVSSSGQHIRILGINLPGGKSFVATFSVDVACGGQGVWATDQQKAYAASDGTGTSFEFHPELSTGIPTNITTACHLGFVNQPTDTDTGSIIRDGGDSNGNSITVGLFDETGTRLSSCPVGYEAGCSVIVDKTGSGGTLSGTLTKGLVGSPLVATFDDLSITTSALADQFNLTAAGVGGFAPTATSASFLVGQDITGLSCTGNSCSSPGHAKLSGGILTDSFADVSSSTGFTFMTLSPFTLTGTPDGCAGIKSLGVTGFAESDGRRAGSGTLTIRYYVNKDKLEATYGKNVGNQFVPMCVGGRPVDTATGVIHDCNDPNFHSVGWLGDAISPSTGRFTGKSANAVCNPDGYYWGIISSYQDKLDATTNPTVTNWGGTQIGGNNYRFFDMTVPANWDWRAGPG